MTSLQILFLISAVCFFGAAIIQHRKEGGQAGTARLFLASLIAMLFVALTACSTPATRTETVEVKIPVAVQPLKPEQVPTPPAPLGPRPQNLSAAADTLHAKVCEWVAYGLRADPLLRLSAGQPPRELPKFAECER